MTRQPPSKENNPTEKPLQRAKASEVDHSTLIIETLSHTAVKLHQISLQLHAIVETLTNGRKTK